MVGLKISEIPEMKQYAEIFPGMPQDTTMYDRYIACPTQDCNTVLLA